jgi:hypothetical protein
VIDNVAQFPTKLERLLVLIAELSSREAVNRKKWIQITLSMCAELADARAEFRADREFGEWCRMYFELNHNDRAAYIKMGQDLDLAREVLENTDRKSISHIYRNEFKPRRDNYCRYRRDDSRSKVVCLT